NRSVIPLVSRGPRKSFVPARAVGLVTPLVSNGPEVGYSFMHGQAARAVAPTPHVWPIDPRGGDSRHDLGRFDRALQRPPAGLPEADRDHAADVLWTVDGRHARGYTQSPGARRSRRRRCRGAQFSGRLGSPGQSRKGQRNGFGEFTDRPGGEGRRAATRYFF